MRKGAAEAEQGDVAGPWSGPLRRAGDLGRVTGQAFEIALGVAVQMPVRHIEGRVDALDDPGALVDFGEQHQAIDAGALDPRGMVKRRADPALRFTNHGSPLLFKLGHLIHNETARR